MNKKPLYRKRRNNESFAHLYNRGHADYKHTRNKKKQVLDDDGSYVSKKKQAMNNTSPNGYDYTPLYRFLQSKAGKNWNDVFSEAKSRLDREEPIWYIVFSKKPNEEIIRLGESTYCRTLFIDENNILQYTNKNAILKQDSRNVMTVTLDGKIVNKHE